MGKAHVYFCPSSSSPHSGYKNLLIFKKLFLKSVQNSIISRIPMNGHKLIALMPVQLLGAHFDEKKIVYLVYFFSDFIELILKFLDYWNWQWISFYWSGQVQSLRQVSGHGESDKHSYQHLLQRRERRGIIQERLRAHRNFHCVTEREVKLTNPRDPLQEWNIFQWHDRTPGLSYNPTLWCLFQSSK